MHRGLMPWKEVAGHLGITEREARETGHLALKKMKGLLAGLGITPEDFTDYLHDLDRREHSKAEGRRMMSSGTLPVAE